MKNIVDVFEHGFLPKVNVMCEPNGKYKPFLPIYSEFGNFSVSYGDYEDTGSNFLLGYGFSLGDYNASAGYSSFSAETSSGLEDEDGLFFTVGASF